MELAWTRGWTRLSRVAVKLGYVGVVMVFVFVVSRFYDPSAGFSYLIAFGGQQNSARVSELESLNYFYQARGHGYDAQYYVQIAMHPSLRNPELREAIDNLPYRARRILTGWTAYVMGVGKPAWILQAYAFQNVLVWLALAAVLLRWFPPDGWSNLFRWAGVLFSVGMCQSLRLALVDGPSLLLIAIGVWCVESNRRWLATGVFALSGLARETNLLGAAALVRPEERNWRHLGELGVQALCVAAPLALWLAYIHAVVGPSIDVGSGNFSLPLEAFLTRWQQVAGALIASNGGDAVAKGGVIVFVSLTVQFVFFVFRPRLRETWWRVGGVFAILMLMLGDAVWEGYPGAATRVLLPMQLAFNVLVPRGRKWLVVLVLGNLSLLVAPGALEALPGYGYRLRGPGELRTRVETREQARVIFDANWYDAEHRADRYWRWASGDATFTVINPHERPVIATVRLYLDGIDQRRATLRRDDRVLWDGAIGVGESQIGLVDIELSPGGNTFDLRTDEPPKMVGIETQRPIVFSLRNLEIQLVRFAP